MKEILELLQYLNSEVKYEYDRYSQAHQKYCV